MELSYLKALPEGGFNFDNCIRNTAMAANSQMSQPIKTMKTGTTICGIIYKVITINPFISNPPLKIPLI